MPLSLEALKFPGLRSYLRGRPGESRTASHKGHICFVALDAWPVLAGADDVPRIGGAEVQQCTLARALSRDAYKTSLITLDHGQPDGEVYDGIACYKTYRQEAGVKMLRFVHPRLTSLLLAMRRADADVYYVRGRSMLAGVVAAYCRRFNRRSVFAAASDLDFLPQERTFRYRRDRWLYERGLRQVDAIVVQTQSQYRNCRENHGRDATWIPSCYEPPAGATADRYGSVLWVSTLRPNKRPELFLELARRLPNRRFVMIGGPGDGSAEMQRYFESLKEQANDHANVEFLGFVPLSKVEGHFDQARCFVNTSQYEGFPNTFLQAWARGVPTAAFVDTGSPVHSVAKSMDELQVQVERLMGDDLHWEESSECCRRYFAANHSVGMTVRRYRNVLKNVLPAFAVE